MSETRKIAAILVSDVVGYSRLAGADEDRTLSRLRGLRSDLIDPAIAAHHGRIVKRTGDGSIVEFRSVVDAVRCAIEVQNAMVERNAGVPEDRRILFRIGIHLGDVVEESDGDLMGDGVNIAARLEGIAEPGAICISEQAYWQVKGRLDLAVTDLGATRLKNIAEPVRAYSLQVGVPAVAKLAIEPKPLKPKKRSMLAPVVAGIVAALIIIAGGTWYFLAGNRSAPVAATAPAARLSMVVLPFANISGDASQDYFADGITESLTTDLSRLSGAFVIARNTAFTFKGKPMDAKQIGADLGVRYVLEGSVQRDAARVRVNAQLIDAGTGNHLWAERFDKPLANLLDMQDEIVARLANQLGTQLVAAEARRTKAAPNPDSMDLYFQGMALVNRGVTTLETLEQARGFFVRALALDASNVDAMGGSSWVDLTEAGDYLVEDQTGHYAAAEATLNKVFAVAPNNASAHVWMGFVLDGTNRAPRALAELDRALTLDPSRADAYGLRAESFIFLGRADEVELQVNQALRLSPHDSFAFVWMLLVGAAKIHLGADDQAEAWLRRSMDANPNSPFTHIFLAAALANLGKLPEARVEARAGLALNPKFTVHRFQLGAESDNSVFLAQREHLLQGLRKAGFPEE